MQRLVVLPKLYVEGSNPFTRFISLDLAERVASFQRSCLRKLAGSHRNRDHLGLRCWCKTNSDHRKHLPQTIAKVVDPRPGLLPSGSIHRALPRRAAAIVVDQVVSARSHQNDPKRIACRLQAIANHVPMPARFGAGDRKVLVPQVGQHRRQTDDPITATTKTQLNSATRLCLPPPPPLRSLTPG